VVEDHADGPLTDLRGISFGSVHGSILSRFGASGNPGTVQTLKSLRFSDDVLDEARQADDDDDPVLRLETDFVLMAGVLAGAIEKLIDGLGGEADLAAPEP